MKKLFFDEKYFEITDHYPIVNEKNEDVYFFDQAFKLQGYNSRLTDADGKLLFEMERQLISFMPKYSVRFYNGETLDVHKMVSFAHKEISISTSNERIHLSGDVFNNNFEIINQNEKVIGTVKKHVISFNDSYELDVIDQSYELILVAIVICLNNILDLERSSRASRGK